jgi:hypothetical protein
MYMYMYMNMYMYISQFVFSKIREVPYVCVRDPGKEIYEHFGENAPKQSQCSSQRRGLALRISCFVFCLVARQDFLSMKIWVRWHSLILKTFCFQILISHSDRTFTGKVQVITVFYFTARQDLLCISRPGSDGFVT